MREKSADKRKKKIKSEKNPKLEDYIDPQVVKKEEAAEVKKDDPVVKLLDSVNP